MKVLMLLLVMFSLPQDGDWICSADPVDESNQCSAFDWDADKERAKEKALELCTTGCEAEECIITECRRAVRE